ncbi:NDP-hexose 2,3-dehydratase family protein [Actinomadura syzygii]|uniref:NDP-hexose 2,3-dehydratase family protein n=1 Tax=Actinomadura syzygii TaxID=1427538 RepID=UPI0016527CF1|nr:NDP-hexose 2,3-dehydratase family protein [Actinomadura syzygii]
MPGAQSAATDANRSAGVREWLADRGRAIRCSVTRVPFAELDAWGFDSGTGNLVHDSGRFFAVAGVRVDDDSGLRAAQPILNQPEIGILGLLTREADGVRRYLVQAKMEPGNINTLQLAPTVQATRSNYTRVHGGRKTRYLEHFRGAGRGRPVVDVLQSEQGSWFLRKRNRNIVVEAAGDIPEHPDFRWMTRAEIDELLVLDNVVGMDIRTVLSCLPTDADDGAPRDEFTDALRRSHDRAAALFGRAEILSWFTEARSACDWRVAAVPLKDVPGWTAGPDELAADGGGPFRVVGARVTAGSREVASWSQPLLEPLGIGMSAFLARPIGGVLHLLARARPQAGLPDLVEMGPTVQLPTDGEPGRTAPFAAEAATEDPARVRFDTVLSEEGGRFFHAQTRYRVIDVGADFPLDVPPDFRWVTVRQLMDLVEHKHYLNIEARTLLACVHSLR